MDIRSLLLQYRWDEKKTSECDQICLSYIHRGAKNDEKFILYSEITEVKHRFIVFRDQQGETYIPIHRIKKIWNNITSEVLFEKKSPPTLTR